MLDGGFGYLGHGGGALFLAYTTIIGSSFQVNKGEFKFRKVFTEIHEVRYDEAFRDVVNRIL